MFRWVHKFVRTLINISLSIDLIVCISIIASFIYEKHYNLENIMCLISIFFEASGVM